MSEPLPLIILAGGTPLGSNARGVPAGETLVGLKGALRLPSGRMLVADVARRFLASGRFQQPILIGPREAYVELAHQYQIADVTGSLAASLARAAAVMRDRFGANDPIAISTCDILPSASEIATLLESGYDPVSDCAFWGQLVEADPAALGASAWKPGYQFHDGSSGMRHLYPGHLMIVRPGALRLDIVIRLLHLAYSYRNRPLPQRVAGMVLRSMGMLLRQDLRLLAGRRPPRLTWSIPHHCLRAYRAYRRRLLTVEGFERAFAATFIDDAWTGARPVVFAITNLVPFARDLDTRAEFEQATRGL